MLAKRNGARGLCYCSSTHDALGFVAYPPLSETSKSMPFYIQSSQPTIQTQLLNVLLLRRVPSPNQSVLIGREVKWQIKVRQTDLGQKGSPGALVVFTASFEGDSESPAPMLLADRFCLACAHSCSRAGPGLWSWPPIRSTPWGSGSLGINRWLRRNWKAPAWISWASSTTIRPEVS